MKRWQRRQFLASLALLGCAGPPRRGETPPERQVVLRVHGMRKARSGAT